MRRGQTGGYGAAGESGAWKVVYDHYYWDRLREAYEAASELGAGHWGHGLVGFRMIEGEWITRERGVVSKVNEWLQVEVIPEEVLGATGADSRSFVEAGRADEVPSWLVERIVSSCDEVARRFGFQHGPQVMVSVLSEESDVPWMPGRHGFCIDKHPYEKIVVPAYSVHDPQDLHALMLHEYAHVVSLNTTGGQMPRCLDEAVAMVAGGGIDKRAWRLLESGHAEWKDATELETAYLRDREDEGQRREVWLAYQQSAVIGFYLASLKGDDGIGQMLRAYSNNSLWRDVLLRIRGLGPTDEALKEVYGFGARELFARAFEWLGMHG